MCCHRLVPCRVSSPQPARIPSSLATKKPEEPSKKRGAIYVAFAPELGDLPKHSYVEGKPLASVGFSYQEVGHTAPVTSRLELPLMTVSNASLGLQRGRVLVSVYLALKQAMTAHLTENNQERQVPVLGSRSQMESFWSSL